MERRKSKKRNQKRHRRLTSQNEPRRLLKSLIKVQKELRVLPSKKRRRRDQSLLHQSRTRDQSCKMMKRVSQSQRSQRSKLKLSLLKSSQLKASQRRRQGSQEASLLQPKDQPSI